MTWASALSSGVAAVPAVAFLFAVALLDAFDISLPRGDTVGVSGAICGAALVLLSPLTAIGICLVPLALLELARRRADPMVALGHLSVRLAATLVALMSGLVASTYAEATWVRSLSVLASFLLAELVLTQVTTAMRAPRPLGRLIGGNLTRQSSLIAAQLSAAALILVTYPVMDAWALIPVVALLLMIRQSYSLLLDVRETYRTTTEVLVEVAESQDPGLKGHADRTAGIARAIATRVGLSPAQVETISYAALLHDVDAISVGGTPNHADPGSCSETPRLSSAQLLEGVGFFSAVIPVLRLLDGTAPGDQPPSPNDALAALIVALATDADSAANPAVADGHNGSAVQAVAGMVGLAPKASAVAAAVGLGFAIPAVE